MTPRNRSHSPRYRARMFLGVYLVVIAAIVLSFLIQMMQGRCPVP